MKDVGRAVLKNPEKRFLLSRNLALWWINDDRNGSLPACIMKYDLDLDDYSETASDAASEDDLDDWSATQSLSTSISVLLM